MDMAGESVSVWFSVLFISSVREDLINVSRLVVKGSSKVIFGVIIMIEILKFFLGWLVDLVDLFFGDDGLTVGWVVLGSSLFVVDSWFLDTVGLLWEKFAECKLVEGEL